MFRNLVNVKRPFYYYFSASLLRGRTRGRKDESEGSECDRASGTGSWFKFQEKIEQSEGGTEQDSFSGSSSRWSFKRKDRSKSDQGKQSGDRSTTSPPSDDHSTTKSGTSSIRFHMPKRKVSASPSEMTQSTAEKKKSGSLTSGKSATVSTCSG